MRQSQLALLASAILASASAVSAQGLTVSSPDGRRQVTAVRVSEAITIDGRLNEPVWSTAGPAAGFVQADPREGEPATEDTEVRVVFDDDSLYVGVRCRDSEPDGIVINDIRKDFAGREQDTFEVLLDTFADRRNGFVFATNAAAPRPTRRLPTKDATSIPTGTRCGGCRRTAMPTAGRPNSASRSRRCAFTAATHTRGASTSRAASAARTRSATGRPCRAPTRSTAPRLEATSKACRRSAGTQPPRQAVPAGRRGARLSAAVVRSRSRRRRGHQGGHDAVAHARRDDQPGLRAGRSRRAAGESHAIQPVLPGEARVLPRELRHLLLRRHPAQHSGRSRDSVRPKRTCSCSSAAGSA